MSNSASNCRFIKVADLSDLAPDAIKHVQVDGLNIALCRSGDKYYALEDKCTHQDAPLHEGQIIDEQLECPWHGARFELATGAAACLPAVRGVPVFDVDVRGDEIWVSTSPRLSGG